MNLLTKLLVTFVILIHLAFFILEALFWMNPIVYTILLKFLDNPVSIDYATQALTLKNLFINQGFYNLFLAVIGLLGVYLLVINKRSSGYLLILVLCFFGFGAGIVLAFTTQAHALAFFQSIPALISFLRVYPLYKLSVKTEQGFGTNH